MTLENDNADCSPLSSCQWTTQVQGKQYLWRARLFPIPGKHSRQIEIGQSSSYVGQQLAEDPGSWPNSFPNWDDEGLSILGY